MNVLAFLIGLLLLGSNYFFCRIDYALLFNMNFTGFLMHERSLSLRYALPEADSAALKNGESAVAVSWVAQQHVSRI